jgi:hypothetical protein
MLLVCIPYYRSKSTYLNEEQVTGKLGVVTDDESKIGQQYCSVSLSGGHLGVVDGGYLPELPELIVLHESAIFADCCR